MLVFNSTSRIFTTDYSGVCCYSVCGFLNYCIVAGIAFTNWDSRCCIVTRNVFTRIASLFSTTSDKQRDNKKVFHGINFNTKL